MAKRIETILNKRNFRKFFELLTAKFRVFGSSQSNGDYSFIEIDSSDKIKFDYPNTKMSVKEFFFPQTENLFVFDAEKNKVSHTDNEAMTHNMQKILFGVRPCDALSISLLDKVFMESEPPDPYYIKRKDSTRVISLACNYPRPTCFCTSVGCGPDSETGADIIFFDLKDRFLIKSVTPEGGEILESVKTLLNPVTSYDLEEKTRSMLEAKNRVKKNFELDGLEKKLDNFDASYWDKLYEKCLGCGICTYLCPTCHCFDITDEVIKTPHPSLPLKGGGRKGGGRRVRTWDSCMFSLFVLHASGHNPRPTQKERMRQRIMHKFNYTLKNYNQIFCVGCGRCVTHCPVNIDIRHLIKEIMGER